MKDHQILEIEKTLDISLFSSFFFSPFFSNEESGAQRSEVIYPRSHNKLMTGTGLELKLFNSLFTTLFTEPSISAYCYFVVSLCMFTGLCLAGDSLRNLV